MKYLKATPHSSYDPAITFVLNKYKDDIQEAADLHDLDPRIIAGMMVIESEGRATATSVKNARGCMQTLAIADADVGMIETNSYDCRVSLAKGTHYLATLRDRYGFTNPYHAVAAYNIGPSRAKTFTVEKLENCKYLRDVRAVVGRIPEDTFS